MTLKLDSIVNVCSSYELEGSDFDRWRFRPSKCGHNWEWDPDYATAAKL